MRPLLLLAVTLAVGLGLASPAAAQRFVVEPYLQWVTPTRAFVMWETSSGAPGAVEWGTTQRLGRTSTGRSRASHAGQYVHSVALEGLSPATRYHYRVRTGSLVSGTYAFRSAPPASAQTRFRLLAMSDMQQDWKRPDQFRELVEESVLPLVREEYDDALEDALALVLLPGDLVGHGRRSSSWARELFAPMKRLSRQVPLYPAIGNHDEDSDDYFAYFHLPDNGSPGFAEHWWWTDYVNVRLIGLDTNTGYRNATQLAWLERVLANACANEATDFVIVELHHPEKSELWPSGETTYTGDIARKLESFSTRCGKPSFTLSGHTHAYSRGHSRHARHTMVGVASAGGDLDYAGEYRGYNDPDYAVSQDEYGYVLLEVESGEDPSITLRRISLGNALLPRDSEERDRVVVRRYDQPPSPPTGLWPRGRDVDPACSTVRLSDFSDPEGDAHLATELEFADERCDFTRPLSTRFVPQEDVLAGIAQTRGRDARLIMIGSLSAQRTYCYRARVRDESLAWSDWSKPVRFTTRHESTGVCREEQEPDVRACTNSGNLLQNASAEEGLAGYAAAHLESLASGECNSVPAFDGARFFAVGGVCGGERDRAEAVQRVSLAGLHELVESGHAQVRFGGMLRTYDGRDRASLRVRFRSASGELLSESPLISSEDPHWSAREGKARIPPKTRSLELVLRGERRAGEDNDSYFDALYLRVEDEADVRCR